MFSVVAMTLNAFYLSSRKNSGTVWHVRQQWGDTWWCHPADDEHFYVCGRMDLHVFVISRGRPHSSSTVLPHKYLDIIARLLFESGILEKQYQHCTHVLIKTYRITSSESCLPLKGMNILVVFPVHPLSGHVGEQSFILKQEIVRKVLDSWEAPSPLFDWVDTQLSLKGVVLFLDTEKTRHRGRNISVSSSQPYAVQTLYTLRRVMFYSWALPSSSLCLIMVGIIIAVGSVA